MQWYKIFNKSPKIELNRKPQKLIILTVIMYVAFGFFGVYMMFYYQSVWPSSHKITLKNIPINEAVHLYSDVNLLDYFEPREDISIKFMSDKHSDYSYSTVAIDKITAAENNQFTYAISIKDGENLFQQQNEIAGFIYTQKRSEKPIYKLFLDSD